MIVIVVLVRLRLVLPRAARRGAASARTRRCRTTVAVGDEIITAGGIHGVVREADEDELRIEIAPGVVVTLDRRAVAAVADDEPRACPRPRPDPDAS